MVALGTVPAETMGCPMYSECELWAGVGGGALYDVAMEDGIKRFFPPTSPLSTLCLYPTFSALGTLG